MFEREIKALWESSPIVNSSSVYSQQCYDATWTLALALNESITSELFSTFSIKFTLYVISMPINVPCPTVLVLATTTIMHASMHNNYYCIFHAGINSDTKLQQQLVEFNGGQEFNGLQHFTYNNSKFVNLLYGHLNNTEFEGISVRI